MRCPEANAGLGAYVLGALEPDERSAIEDHLRGCATCSAELAGLQGLPALLARVRPEDIEPVSVTPSLAWTGWRTPSTGSSSPMPSSRCRRSTAR